MCGKGIHRVEDGYYDRYHKVWVDKKICYMDYFCTVDTCPKGMHDEAHAHGCNCPLEEDDD